MSPASDWKVFKIDEVYYGYDEDFVACTGCCARICLEDGDECPTCGKHQEYHTHVMARAFGTTSESRQVSGVDLDDLYDD